MLQGHYNPPCSKLFNVPWITNTPWMHPTTPYNWTFQGYYNALCVVVQCSVDNQQSMYISDNPTQLNVPRPVQRSVCCSVLYLQHNPLRQVNAHWAVERSSGQFNDLWTNSWVLHCHCYALWTPDRSKATPERHVWQLHALWYQLNVSTTVWMLRSQRKAPWTNLNVRWSPERL